MSVAFDVVFGVFVLAMIVLGVLAIRWGVRRDRVARAHRAPGVEPGADETGADEPGADEPVTPASSPNGSSS